MTNSNPSEKITVLYERLSNDDDRYDESISIENQKSILEDYVFKNNLTPFEHFSDDGYSGAKWDRPGWLQLMKKVDADEVATVIVKNLDRLGRDYIRVGLFREKLRVKNIRLIAISDGVDTFKNQDDFLPIRELVADLYAQDCSRKVKAVVHKNGNEGKPLSYNAIYGYKKSPEDKNIWLVDDEAAAVVKRIFDMTLNGMGIYAIARRLSDEKIEKPSAYFARIRGTEFKGKDNALYAWNGSTVGGILAKPEYCGKTVNFRTTREGNKEKGYTKRPKEEWKIFDDTHPAIIDDQTFQFVQELRKTLRRPNSCGDSNPLTGKAICADCHSSMYNVRMQNATYTSSKNGHPYQHKSPDCYYCSTSKLSRGVYVDRCSPHFVRTEILRKTVLDTFHYIRNHILTDKSKFISSFCAKHQLQHEKDVQSYRLELEEINARLAKIEILYKTIYEDKVTGQLSEQRYKQYAANYEQERLTLESRQTELQEMIHCYDDVSERVANFIKLVYKYADSDELTAVMINELIDKIVVHEADKGYGGERRQQIDVYFHYIGLVEVPTQEPALTADELAARQKRLDKLAKQREATRKYQAKKKLEYQQINLTSGVNLKSSNSSSTIARPSHAAL